MRLKLVIAAAAALALIGPPAAHAQLSLSPLVLSNTSPANGDMVTVSGTISNGTTMGDLFVDGDTPSLSGFGPNGSGANQGSINDLLAPSLPLGPLAAGTDTGLIPLFTFTMDPTIHDVDFYVYSLDANGTSIVSDATGNFTFGTAAVPEPGSVGLLVGGALGSGLFLLRRRRK
jgi:hypothetical protein